MADGGGGDDVVLPVSPLAQQPSAGGRRGHRQKAAWLPLDIIAEIAARSDPATLVRCAATCRDARRRIAEDPDLRDTERFVLPLLRGHMTRITTYTRSGLSNTDMYLVDAVATTAADSTRLVKATFASGPEAETLSNVVPMDSRRTPPVSIQRFMRDKCVPRLELFGERSGALLLRIPGCCLLWLDLHTKKILRCFSLDRLLHAEVFCPYEMDLSSWVPTFDSAVISFD